MYPFKKLSPSGLQVIVLLYLLLTWTFLPTPLLAKEEAKFLVRWEDLQKRETRQEQSFFLSFGAQEFAQELQRLSKAVPGNFAFVAIDPARGQSFVIEAETAFEAASIYKLFLAAAVLEAEEEGRLVLDPWDYQAIEWAISLSDNPSSEYLGQKIGWNEVEAFLIRHGYEQTSFNPMHGGWFTGTIETTAGDVSRFLRDLATGKLLGPERTAYFFKLLENQKHTHGVNLGLPSQAVFLHKTGWLEQVFHDAGYLVCAGRGLSVVVMTEGWTAWSEEASAFYRALGQALEKYLHDSAIPLQIQGQYPMRIYDLQGAMLTDFVQGSLEKTQPQL